MVLFEVPTGIVADMKGRRASFLLGTVTLAVTTGLYVLLWRLEAPFWQWAVVSLLLGLGFTFFSGATEAWLVDALNATGFEGRLESVFGRGQMLTGVGMLTGSALGGYIAAGDQPGFAIRAEGGGPGGDVRRGVRADARSRLHAGTWHERRGGDPHSLLRLHRLRLARSGREVPDAAPWTGGVGIFAFYALQPYLLDLYGDPEAYGIAGLAAAIVAGAQILGGFVAP